jgi:hypothetical protein
LSRFVSKPTPAKKLQTTSVETANDADIAAVRFKSQVLD